MLSAPPHKRHRLYFEDAKKHRTRERVERLFRKLSELDPLYGETREVMDFSAQGLPPSAQRALDRMFERCPQEARLEKFSLSSPSPTSRIGRQAQRTGHGLPVSIAH